MKTLKKCIAFVLAAGLMLSAMTVFAKEYTGTTDPKDDENNKLEEGDTWTTEENGESVTYTWYNGKWCLITTEVGGGSCVTSSRSDEPSGPSQEEIAAIQSQAEAAAVQGAASDEGFTDVGDMYRAAEKGMSAGEYYNNAVTSTPGIENAITVGQGGNLVVNGVQTNMSATISKVTNRAYVDSVRVEQEGTVLNVVDVQYPAVEATINFYMPSVTDEMEIVALQYNAGVWVNVEVAEVRADHVVLNMKGNGVVAFIAK